MGQGQGSRSWVVVGQGRGWSWVKVVDGRGLRLGVVVGGRGWSWGWWSKLWGSGTRLRVKDAPVCGVVPGNVIHVYFNKNVGLII